MAKRSYKKKSTYKWSVFVSIPLLVIVVLIIYSAWFFAQTVVLKKTIDIQIQDQSISKTVQLLEQKGIISSPFPMLMIAELYGTWLNKQCVIGEYRILPTLTHGQLLKLIFSGKQSYTVNVSFPEGIQVKKIASICAQKLGIDSAEFIELAHKDSLLKHHLIKGNSLEGYLMPDTYNFYWKQNPHEIISKLLAVQSSFWNETCFEKVQKQSLNKHQILTLASIIEAEAIVDEERPIISGVYHNRLKKGMNLAADPTVQYALGKSKRLLYSDLKIDNPYNTYRFSGLPPGPINCPGRQSILAAIQPAKHQYYFFVALGDGSGKHVFSETAIQHMKAVQSYRKQRQLNNQ